MVEKGLKTVPAEPIRRAIERWIEEREGLRAHANANNWDTKWEFTGLQQAVWAIFRQVRGENGKRNITGERILYRLLDRREGYSKPKKSTAINPRGVGSPLKQESITFDLADKVLCGLDLQHLWVEDPELWEAYQKVDLAAIDYLHPTSAVTAAEAEEKIWQAYLETGSVKKTRAALHIPHDYIEGIVQGRRVEAA